MFLRFCCLWRDFKNGWHETVTGHWAYGRLIIMGFCCAFRLPQLFSPTMFSLFGEQNLMWHYDYYSHWLARIWGCRKQNMNIWILLAQNKQACVVLDHVATRNFVNRWASYLLLKKCQKVSLLVNCAQTHDFQYCRVVKMCSKSHKKL